MGYDRLKQFLASSPCHSALGSLKAAPAGNWVSSTLLPAECRALYWNLFQAPEREGRIRPQDIAPMGRRSGPQVSYPLRRIVTAVNGRLFPVPQLAAAAGRALWCTVSAVAGGQVSTVRCACMHACCRLCYAAHMH